jgi:hypothetical protein
MAKHSENSTGGCTIGNPQRSEKLSQVSYHCEKMDGKK